MNLEQLRARALEISNRLAEIGDEPTEEQINEMIELGEEFEGISNKIRAFELKASAAKTAANAGRKAPAAAPSPAPKAGGETEVKNGGFKNLGDFAMAVRASRSGSYDPRFKNLQQEKIGEDGGFLVPEEFVADIVTKMEGDESLLALTTKIPLSGNAITFNIDEAQPWNSGVIAYWTAEGAPITGSSGKLGQASLKLEKLAALVPVTEEILEDSTALEAWLKKAAPAAIMWKVNSAILVGDGVGKPTGVIKSPFRVTVAKESGQAADTVVARNVINMFARMIPSSRAKARWYINAAVEPQLLTLKDDNDNFIYLAPFSQLNQQPYGLLLGRPVVPMMGSLPALGDEGDIVFADLSYYYSAEKAGGIKAAASQHLYFDQDKTAFRFTMRLDGKCPFKAPVKVENGDYTMSAVVTLASRA